MNIKVLLVAIAVCLLLVSGTEGFRRKHESSYEKRIVQEVGEGVAEELEDLMDSLTKGFKDFFGGLRRR